MEFCITGHGSKLTDKWCIEEMGIPSVVLMERAALALSDEILKDLNNNVKQKVIIVCGCGNNGADGLAAGRILVNKGIDTDIYIVGNADKASEEFNIQYNILEKMKVNINMADGNSIKDIPFDSCAIIVDAIFGIGLSRLVEGKYKKIIDMINESGKKVISADVPSGLCADRGIMMGCCVNAYKTVTFGKLKSGLVLCDSKNYSGEIIVKDVGFLNEAYNNADIENEIYDFYVREDLKLIPDRLKNSNKGSYGTVTVIAGSENMSGAAVMCANAVYRCGAGIVKVFTHRESMDIVRNNIYEAIVEDYENDVQLSDKDIVVIGPGLSVCEKSVDLVRKVLESGCRAVIDADGLNVISNNKELLDKLHENVIVTPHIKEMSRLCGREVSYIRENIVKAAREFSEKYKCITVIKDATTVISDINGKITVNMSGNSGMSTGGSGDVLAGIIGGMMSQKLSVYQSACLGVFVHGMAGDVARDELTEYGMMASDIINAIPHVFKMKTC